MRSLTFTILTTQLFRNEQELRNLGLVIEYLPQDNFYQDQIQISYQNGFSKCFFLVEHRAWDALNEFYLFTDTSCRHHYRLNPINGDPIKSDQHSIWSSPSLTPDLEHFGNQVISVIHKISERIKHDQLGMILNHH